MKVSRPHRATALQGVVAICAASQGCRASVEGHARPCDAPTRQQNQPPGSIRTESRFAVPNRTNLGLSPFAEGAWEVLHVMADFMAIAWARAKSAWSTAA